MINSLQTKYENNKKGVKKINRYFDEEGNFAQGNLNKNVFKKFFLDTFEQGREISKEEKFKVILFFLATFRRRIGYQR